MIEAKISERAYLLLPDDIGLRVLRPRGDATLVVSGERGAWELAFARFDAITKARRGLYEGGVKNSATAAARAIRRALEAEEVLPRFDHEQARIDDLSDEADAVVRAEGWRR